MKESCIHLSGKLFFEISHKTLKFQQILLLLQKKDLNKHDRMEVFSTDSHGKNSCFSTMYKPCFAVRRSVGNAFFGSLETWNPIFFPFVSTMGATLRNHWTKQTVKKLNLWGKNGCRQKCLDKSLQDKALALALGTRIYLQRWNA